MANKVTMELEGLSDLLTALRALPPTIKREPIIYRALHDGARIITAEAKRLAPVLRDHDERRRRPGVLRSNIVQHASKSEDLAVLVRVRSRGYIHGDDPRLNLLTSPAYWHLMEFGTSKMAAHPFLRPAFESKKTHAARAIQLSLLRGIFAVGQKLGLRMEI